MKFSIRFALVFIVVLASAVNLRVASAAQCYHTQSKPKYTSRNTHVGMFLCSYPAF